MPSSDSRLRTMIAEMKRAGLDNDEIARLARIPRGNVFRFVQGDGNALANDFDKVASAYQAVIHKAPLPER